MTNNAGSQKLTPMMKQYLSMKEKNPDSILFFRMGDFYEMFLDDALEAAKLLQITLTSRNKGDDKAPMCGVPYHAADAYIAKLTKMGKKVAICEQITDPGLPGLVERDIVRVVTPGTTLDDSVLDQNTNNYVLAIKYINNVFSLAYADISTGEFRSTGVSSEKDLNAEIERIAPAEIILDELFFESDFASKLKKNFESIFFFPFNSGQSSGENATEFLMDYFRSTQKTALKHVSEPKSYEINEFMPLDEATLRNLELLQTMRENKKEGSLLWVLDKTQTPMGGRLLKHILTHPLINKVEIDLRVNAVEALINNHELHEDLVLSLKNIMDMERLLSRLSMGRGNARDLIGLKNSLNMIPSIKQLLKGSGSKLLDNVKENLDELPDIRSLVEKAINDEPPVSISDGGMIRDGFNSELDEYRVISREGKSFIQNLQISEIDKTGINNLKVRYNKIFGYYIEVSKGQVDKVPENYIRKQTLVNAERYITPELKEFEEKILGAEDKIVALEQKLFTEIRERVVKNIDRIQATARQIALLDVVCGFAATAKENHYCRPEIVEEGDIEILEGRHPVVEKMSTDMRFVPNDSALTQNGERILLITGPNMGGKSTFLRQTALITLMAQIGSFVPAKSAKIAICDRIFTRVGASDNLVKGQSTFMVEMQETCYIISNATNRSLIILDEVGRGTSTYDGMSIAWAIFEYLHDKIQAKTLFATHYHELISLANKLGNAANYAVAVTESEDEGVVFLYKVVRGGVDRSYGIEVAKLAGLPDDLVSRANQILTDLEEGVLEKGIANELRDATKRVPESQLALGLRTDEPEFREHGMIGKDVLERDPAIEELKNIDLNSLTPLEALNRLNEIKKNL